MQSFIRNIAAVYILLLMLLKMMALPLTCLEYQLNKDHIAANLCENKDKPLLNCFGQCYLDKQLVNSGELPLSNSDKSSTHALFVSFNPAAEITLSHPLRDDALIHTSFYQHRLPKGFSGAVFHPPSLLS